MPLHYHLSREVEPGYVLRVALAPESGVASSAEKQILKGIAAGGRRTIPNRLHDLGIPKKLARAVLVAWGIPSQISAANLTPTARRAIVESLALGHPFPVEGAAGWEAAMVTRGGVALSQVEPKTMESRVVPGLFFAGEILDVDGESGGYNLQAAFSTGFLAGRSAARKILGVRP